jgi:hypothetical protein
MERMGARVVQLVTQHADEALPGLALLVAQRAREVGEHEEAVRDAVLPEHPAADLEAAGTAGEGQLQDLPRPGVQRPLQPQLARGAAEQPLQGLEEEALARAVHELQAMRGVEGEDGHLDLLHDLAQEGRRLEGSQALLAQGVRERVDLAHHQGERVLAACAAGAEREVLLAEGGQEVRQRAQRPHHVALHGEGEGEPGEHHQEVDRPFRLRRVPAHAHEREHGHDAGHAGQEREEEDLVLEAQPGSATPSPRGHTAAGGGRARCG